MSIAPFTIPFSKVDVDDLRQRLDHIRWPDTAATPVIVRIATKHSTISEPMMALLARGVTTNNVSTNITNRAVKLYSCSQNRARLHARVIVGQDRFLGGINFVSILFFEKRCAMYRVVGGVPCPRFVPTELCKELPFPPYPIR